MIDTSRVKAMTVVKFKSRLSEDELKKRYPERMPDFREVPGLVQKFYVYDEPAGEWGGIYLWDSEASARSYMASDLRKTIGSFYEVDGPPRVDALSVLDVLRE